MAAHDLAVTLETSASHYRRVARQESKQHGCKSAGDWARDYARRDAAAAKAIRAQTNVTVSA